MRVAITGASGLIGQALIPLLRAGGHETVSLVRRAANPGEVHWDPATGSLDPADLEGIDAAINLAGENIATRWTREARRRIRDSRIQGTRLLAGTMATLVRKPTLLISVSAVGIYGDRGDEVLTEGSGPGQGFLPQLAQEWEQAAEPAHAAGIRVVYPRFGIVLSREGGALDKMLLPFKLGIGGRLGSGRQWMSWIAIDDLVTGLLHLLHTETLHGPVNFASPGAVRNQDFTRCLARVLARPAIIPVPPLALYLMYGHDMPRETLLVSSRVVPRKLEESGFRFRYPELEPALRHVLER